MNRERKYRLWDGQKMIGPFSLRDIPELVMGHLSHNPDAIVMDYTSSKDKFGNEIYEGDILEGHSDGIVKVVWVDDAWECIFADEGNIMLAEITRYFGNNAVVIGNIFDTPQLFK